MSSLRRVLLGGPHRRQGAFRLAPRCFSAVTPFLQRTEPAGLGDRIAAVQSFLSGGSMQGADSYPWNTGFPSSIQGADAWEPQSLDVDWKDLKEPKQFGMPALRAQIANYYNDFYGAKLDPENVIVLDTHNHALVAVTAFLESDLEVRVASTETPAYLDMLFDVETEFSIVHSGADNEFLPQGSEYYGEGRTVGLLSNPCNPTGVTRTGDNLKSLLQPALANPNEKGLIVDEVNELFHEPPVSALAYIEDINKTNVIIVSAPTKGLEGNRVAWVIASKDNIETLGNFSKFGVGGIKSTLNQQYAMQLLQGRHLAREAIPKAYAAQRALYASEFQKLGLKVKTGGAAGFAGAGGFFHWLKLPGDLSASELNSRMQKSGAKVLPGFLCDLSREGDQSDLHSYFRFSFGRLTPEEYNFKAFRAALRGD